MTSIYRYLNATRQFVVVHKILSGIVIVVLAGGGYWEYGRLTSTAGVTHYILGTVATGTIVASVSESGQVSSSDSIDVKPQVSGTITWIGVTAGQHVSAGQAIASIDDTDAQQTLTDAKKQLAADQLQFQKDQAQAPISYQNDVQALATAKENLSDDYNTTYNDLSSTYLDLPAVMTTANDTLYGYDIDTKKSEWNMDALSNLFTTTDTQNVTSFMTGAKSDYATANTDYTAGVDTYKTTTRTSQPADIDTVLDQSTTMMTSVAQALQSELNFLGAVSDLADAHNIRLPSAFSTLQNNTRSALSTANSDLSTLLGDKKTLDNAKQAITNAQQTITLDQVGNNGTGSNPISLQISQNSLEKEQADIATQETNLAKYTIVAPFSGTVSTVPAKVGDTAGSAAVATVISNSQIATLSLNEIDAAKVVLGDKVTLTFDAINGLSLAGAVAEIDTVGTVSQGVVSYNVQVSFATQDTRVKPGMTVNADIQTAVAQNTLTVPSSAVKTVGGRSVVMVFNPPIPQTTVTAAGSSGVVSVTPPASVPVTTGISDNTNLQILSGLTAGEQVVISTKTGSATTVSAAAAATTRATGGGVGGGGGAAVLRGL